MCHVAGKKCRCTLTLARAPPCAAAPLPLLLRLFVWTAGSCASSAARWRSGTPGGAGAGAAAAGKRVRTGACPARPSVPLRCVVRKGAHCDRKTRVRKSDRVLTLRRASAP